MKKKQSKHHHSSTESFSTINKNYNNNNNHNNTNNQSNNGNSNISSNSNNSQYDQKLYPSFLYQIPSFQMNSFSRYTNMQQDRDSTPRNNTKSYKSNKSHQQNKDNIEINQQSMQSIMEIEQTEDTNQTKECKNNQNSLHFYFENCKMIGRTNSSYVYSLYDKDNNSLNRALKLQLHPKCRSQNQKSNQQIYHNNQIGASPSHLQTQQSSQILTNQSSNHTSQQQFQVQQPQQLQQQQPQQQQQTQLSQTQYPLNQQTQQQEQYNQNPNQNQQQEQSYQQRCMCKMLKTEYQNIDNMNHNNIVRGYRYYENLEIEPGSYCCAIEMELAECNLHQLIVNLSQSKQLSLPFVKRLLHEVCQAINYLHNIINYTHNDIKPDNVFLFFNKSTNQYYAKLADLGTTRPYHTYSNNLFDIVFDNWKLRNPDYQPPEIIHFLNSVKNYQNNNNNQSNNNDSGNSNNNNNNNNQNNTTNNNNNNHIIGFDEKKGDIFNLGNVFFAVLFQLRPFSCRGATENDPLYKLIFEGRIEEFWSQDRFQRMLNYWASFQKQQDMIHMIQLITCMISHDPSIRPNIEQVLAHPWFSQESSQQQQYQQQQF